MAALNDRPRPGRDPTITLEAKAWLTWLSCRKAKELGYPHELWTTRLLARHAREHGPAEGQPCLANMKMAVAQVAAPDWSCAGSRGGGANPRHRASGCRRIRLDFVIVLARVQDIEIGNTVNPKDDSFAINELICSTPRTTRRVLHKLVVLLKGDQLPLRLTYGNRTRFPSSASPCSPSAMSP